MEPALVPQIRILVVGDCVVDEHWITGQHRTTTGSRTSDDYSRVLNSTVSNMTSLCGAGLVASILSSTRVALDRGETPAGRAMRVNTASSAINIEVFGLGL